VTISFSIHGSLLWRRSAPLGIVAALLAALAVAVPAKAETGGANVGAVSPRAAEITAPVEQASSPTPVEQAETTDATSAASEVDVPAEPAEVVSEVEDVASAATSPAPSVKDTASSVPSPSEVTHSASAAVPADLSSGDEPATIDPTAAVSRVVDETRDDRISVGDTAATIDRARRTSTEMIAATTERLTDSRGELALLPGLLNPDLSAAAKETQPPAAAPANTATGSDHPAGFNLRPRSGLLSSPVAAEPDLGPGEYLSDASSLDTGIVRGSMPGHWEIGLSPGTEIVDTGAIAGPGDGSFGNPASPELPPPAPRSPATAVGDAGGPSSVPVVALLALLALVAPAALRRLGEVAAFRPPSPFVCALERPG
jgi:MYXO-CTERM domain-containing protein